MRGINKVILIGSVGKDPETRGTKNGGSVTSLRVATSEKWNDKATGEKKEHTEWHNVVFFGKLADIVAQYLVKGSLIYVEGRLNTEKWQDKEGKDRYTTKIIADEMQMLGGKQNQAQKQSEPQRAESPPSMTQAQLDEFDDDIPFS